MKEHDNHPAFTARDAAKSLIRPYVERGDPLDSLAADLGGIVRAADQEVAV